MELSGRLRRQTHLDFGDRVSDRNVLDDVAFAVARTLLVLALSLGFPVAVLALWASHSSRHSVHTIAVRRSQLDHTPSYSARSGQLRVIVVEVSLAVVLSRLFDGFVIRFPLVVFRWLLIRWSVEPRWLQVSHQTNPVKTSDPPKATTIKKIRQYQS